MPETARRTAGGKQARAVNRNEFGWSGSLKIDKVIFLGKSKKKTGNTRFMMKGLRKRVAKAGFINVPRFRKKYFWTDYKVLLYRRIAGFDPDLVLIYSSDIPLEVLEKIRSRYGAICPDGGLPVYDQPAPDGRATVPRRPQSRFLLAGL
jgi:hypothetical protein